MTYPHLHLSDREPEVADVGDLRLHRKRRLALAARVLGALGWGVRGDGYISVRDPTRPDHLWAVRYGVPFSSVTVDQLVLVAADGTTVEGVGDVDRDAHAMHAAIVQIRPELVSVVHASTPFGTPFAALGETLRPISQESCAFFEDHEVISDADFTERGRLEQAVRSSRALIVRERGHVTFGGTVDEAAGSFVLMERCAEVHVRAPDAVPIGRDAALSCRDDASAEAIWMVFQNLLRCHVPDPGVVG